jgi:cell division protein ZapB
MDRTQFKIIERKVEELITLCDELHKENRELKAKEHAWAKERKDLIDKNELAKQRLSHMINRLKSLEQES